MRKCKACGRDFSSSDKTEEICYVCLGALKRLNGYAVPVVRCKDCYLGENCTCVCCEDGEMVYCRKHHKHMNADAFCSDGWRE